MLLFNVRDQVIISVLTLMKYRISDIDMTCLFERLLLDLCTLQYPRSISSRTPYELAGCANVLLEDNYKRGYKECGVRMTLRAFVGLAQFSHKLNIYQIQWLLLHKFDLTCLMHIRLPGYLFIGVCTVRKQQYHQCTNITCIILVIWSVHTTIV